MTGQSTDISQIQQLMKWAPLFLNAISLYEEKLFDSFVYVKQPDLMIARLHLT